MDSRRKAANANAGRAQLGLLRRGGFPEGPTTFPQADLVLTRERLDHAVEGGGGEIASTPLGAGQRGGDLVEISAALLQRHTQVISAEAVATLVCASKGG